MKDGKLKGILGYIMNLKPAWAAWDPFQGGRGKEREKKIEIGVMVR